MSTLYWGFTPIYVQNRAGLPIGPTAGGYRTALKPGTPKPAEAGGK
ncbi:hypothetical protein C8J29_106152 [Cereibacter johrii]|uniref:Uncharacterized protein n=1 Tax=Cereibacter johrii TaxID=445629 RepID=A0ABX5J7I2_9RHOB|nr:hypothetical protein C8J29_106152 [Cereibacter johrii]